MTHKQLLASKRSRDLAQAIANFFLVNARRISIYYCCYRRLSKRSCISFWAIARVKTRPSTYRVIAWSFDRLAIASVYIWIACFQNRLHPPPTCYSFALLTSFCNWNRSSLIAYVPIMGCFYLTYCIMFIKWLKVGMSDMQELTEEVLEWNKTLFLCFSLYICSKLPDRVRKQFSQLWNLFFFSYLLF